MRRLEQPFELSYQRFHCWGEIHSLERFRQRWPKLQRLFFSNSDRLSHNYVIFSHGNLLSSIVTFLRSGGSWDRCQFGNIAPHCSVTVLSYTAGDALPEIVLTPFQICTQSLPVTINNVSPRRMKLEEMLRTETFTEPTWTIILHTIIPVSETFVRRQGISQRSSRRASLVRTPIKLLVFRDSFLATMTRSDTCTRLSNSSSRKCCRRSQAMLPFILLRIATPTTTTTIDLFFSRGETMKHCIN